MSLLDDILQQLANGGPADAATLAEHLGRDAPVVARMLGKLRADGRVVVDDDGTARVASARRKQTAAVREDEPVTAEVVDEPAPQMRCWVYSDGCFGLGRGETVLELSTDEVRQLARFLGGALSLLDAAAGPAIEHQVRAG